ncbi:inx [Lepeophtheirus salmonis]|uniref:Innexin n=1 Tax=Lepeophtheirus salmonis TaxID=72036 RepID=A0A7R8CFS1_LEPSM|nr:inx [Lepeophtheirus salmonis]CAF2762527.1 inx [Lepeophtheirus salmonis]
MFDVFGSVKILIKIDTICIDNNIFRLHYKATVILLIICSLLVTCRQYIGDPIDCIVEEIPPNVMDTYCWIHSTFSVPEHDKGVNGKDIPHRGIGPESSKEPYRYFVEDLGGWKNVRTVNRFNHQFYTLKFFFCELLNFINVISQIFFTDFFLGGQFTTYGSEVLSMTELEPDQRSDPLSRVFPKMTKCTFHKFGPSGTIEKFDGLCVLPLNIINEKIYVFLWFWFIIVSVITGMHVIYRILTIVVPQLRVILLRATARLSSAEKIQHLGDFFSLGDWFVLYQLGKNIDPLIYKEFIDKLEKAINGRTTSSAFA